MHISEIINDEFDTLWRAFSKKFTVLPLDCMTEAMVKDVKSLIIEKEKEHDNIYHGVMVGRVSHKEFMDFHFKDEKKFREMVAAMEEGAKQYDEWFKQFVGKKYDMFYPVMAGGKIRNWRHIIATIQNDYKRVVEIMQDYLSPWVIDEVTGGKFEHKDAIILLSASDEELRQIKIFLEMDVATREIDAIMEEE